MRTIIEMATLDIDAAFKEVLEYSHHGERSQAAVDAAAFDRLVESRRSVRVFDETESGRVPADVVQRCLDLAMMAANSSNLQPWEFYWVRSADKKAQLVRWCMSQPAARTAAELIVCVARTATWRKHAEFMLAQLSTDPRVPKSALDYYRLGCPLIYTQGWNIVGLFKWIGFNAIGLFKPIPREPIFSSGMRLWATKSVCLAASVLMLAFRSRGFDTCAMEGVDQRRVSRLLSLPSDASIPMVLAVGRRVEQGVYGDRIRFDRDWFVKVV